MTWALRELGEHHRKERKQVGAELGQAQLKLGLEFTSIFCIFGFSGFSFYLKGLIEKNWFSILGSLHFKHLRRFNFVDFFWRLGLVNFVQHILFCPQGNIWFGILGLVNWV